MTLEELEEAANLGVIGEMVLYCYQSGQYKIPTVIRKGKKRTYYYELCNYNPYDVENIKLMQNSEMWSEAREKYRPKEWYELEENVGKIVEASEFADGNWDFISFAEYIEGDAYPFVDKDGNNYKCARPISTDRLAKEQK